MKKIFFAAGCGALLCSPLGPAAQAQSQPTSTLTYATEVLPSTWAPFGVVSNEWLHLLYETLVQRDPSDPTKLSPLLATGWEQDETSLTLRLRDDVLFHDGSPFNAAAVKANLDKILNEGWPASGNLKAIASSKVIDDTTIRLELSSPNPFLLHSLSGTYIGMGSPRAIADGTISKKPVGTGPYTLNERETVPGGKAVLNAFPRYRDLDKIKFSRLEISPIADPAARVIAVKTGQVAMAKLEPTVVSLAKSMPDVKWTAWPAYHLMVIFFDRTGTFADARVRQAICSALNTNGNATLLGPEVATATGQRFGPGTYGHAPDAQIQTHDPAKARALLAAAGKPGLSLTLPSIPTWSVLAQALSRQLGDAGVTLRVEQMSLAQYGTVWRSGKHPIGIGQMAGADNPYAFYLTLLAKDAPFNPFKAETPEVDEAVKAALAAGDLAAAEGAWRAVSKIAAEQAIICSDLEFSSLLVYDPKKIGNVRGFVGFSATPYWRGIEPVQGGR